MFFFKAAFWTVAECNGLCLKIHFIWTTVCNFLKSLFRWKIHNLRFVKCEVCIYSTLQKKESFKVEEVNFASLSSGIWLVSLILDCIPLLSINAWYRYEWFDWITFVSKFWPKSAQCNLNFAPSLPAGSWPPSWSKKLSNFINL